MLAEVQAGRPKFRRSLSGGAVVLAASVAAFALLWRVSAGGVSAGAAESYAVDYRVASHVLSAATASNVVMGRLEAMGPASSPKVLKMTVLRMSDVASVESGAGAPSADSPDAGTVVWAVRAEGTFVGLRVPPGAKPIVGSTGYFILDDATGEILGMGTP
jgi:hypothetical protein